MIAAKKDRPVTALIVGAGAVENAWNPVFRALQPHFDFPLTADGANCFLARVVYLLRWWSSSPGDMAKEQLRLHKDFLGEIKKDICREIRISQAQGERKVRAECEAVIDSMLIAHSNSYMLVTTNWDTVVPEALSKFLSRTMDGIGHSPAYPRKYSEPRNALLADGSNEGAVSLSRRGSSYRTAARGHLERS